MHQCSKAIKNRLSGAMECHRTFLRAIIYIAASIALSSLFLTQAFAQNESSSTSLMEYLTQEKTALTITNNELKAFTEPSNLDAYYARKKQLDAMIAVNQVKQANLENILSNQKKEKEHLSQRLKRLQQSPLNKSNEFKIQEKIIKVNSLIEVNNKLIELINDNLLLTSRLNQSLVTLKRHLFLWKAKADLDDQLLKLNDRINTLNNLKDTLYKKNIALQEERKSDVSVQRAIGFEASLLLNNQRILLIQTKINELEQYRKQLKAEFSLLKNQDVKSIEQLINTYENSIEQLMATKVAIGNLQSLIDSDRVDLDDQPLKSEYMALHSDVDRRLQSINSQINQLRLKLTNSQQQLKQQFSLRQSLATYHLSSWPGIATEFIQIPLKFYNYIKGLSLKVWDNYDWQETLSLLLFWCMVAVILVIAFSLNSFLTRIMQEKQRLRLSGHLYDWLLVLIKRNIIQFTFLALIMTTFFMNNISMPSYRLLLNLLLVWLTFRNLIVSARLVLLERISDASGKDVKLYYRLKWLLLAGGWSTALMVFSHQYPLSLLTQDLFDRLFMLFLLALAIVIWKSKDIIPYLLKPVLKAKKRYIRSATVLLINLIPITLLTTAIIGLIGYINLAWTMSRYQVYLLLVITGYVLIRGILADLLELLSEWMIKSLRNGWLWIEVILKPLDKILRLLLLFTGLVILFELFGWYADSWMMTHLKSIGSYQFVNISGMHISLFSVFQFFIVLFIFVWASKWTREFCYRWLYRNSRDAGIRNSLSAFTQYGVILIGAFITLRVLGIDFSGMSMILGGLAVGMGFGLRDFASNIIGGIMLLIERPVREGDLITIGDHEGRVAHIGIRSMRVSSWDNMEVLVPNAETFNKPFTNWTHQDNIVRSVIPIKVSRVDDLFTIQQLILDVLAIIPEILDTPPPQVFLKHIDDALIEFEARYFINVQEHTLFEVRSKALFAITAQFKAAGIKPPIPPLSIELRKSE